ncbi:hypothetical protein GCM10023187_47840 [Nibrella viscosa]|uniref:Uncharacterized protein n=1 Tax=Nibrella viscosa TaxID=1084524 RepID=A0ABP8KU80_9BACT
METSSFMYHMPVPESQTVVLDWVKATEEFYQWYFLIDQVLNRAQSGGRIRPGKKRAAQQTKSNDNVQQLLQLRKQMKDVLSTLMGDMNTAKPTRQAEVSKPGRLVVHTRLLEDLNRNIASELDKLTGAQA